MARKVITTTEYTDDLDGGSAAGTVRFAWDGTNYEIDLSKANTRAFEKALKPYLDNARKVRAARARGRVSSNKRDLGVVREWAAANGYAVSERGRVAATVLEAYDAAN